MFLQKSTVLEVKRKIEARTGIVPADQRLIYGGKQLQDNNVLADYPTMRNGSAIMLVMRLPGGAELVRPKAPLNRAIGSSVPRSSEPCMITFMEGESVCMPCGHSISPDGLMDYCWNEVSSSRKSEIRCCLCESEWTIKTIKAYGGTSDEELRMLEEGLSRNYCLKNPEITECPGCTSFCMRKNTSTNCVHCYICSRKKSKTYYFCWQCLHVWQNGPSASTCGNDGCDADKVLKRLREAPMKNINGVQVPSVRACPSCGSLIEHQSGCKQMNCKNCSKGFCFICLRTKTPEGSWSCGSWCDKCTPAPRQEQVPRPKG